MDKVEGLTWTFAAGLSSVESCASVFPVRQNFSEEILQSKRMAPWPSPNCSSSSSNNKILENHSGATRIEWWFQHLNYHQMCTMISFSSRKTQNCFYAAQPPQLGWPNTIREEGPRPICWLVPKPILWPILLLNEVLWWNPMWLLWWPRPVTWPIFHSYQSLHNCWSDPILRVYRYAPAIWCHACS